MLKNISNGTATTGRECGPILSLEIAQVRHQRLGRIPLKGIFDQPNECIERGGW